MTYLLILAVAVLGALCLLNLLLTVGVIRRLKEHTELLQNLPSGGPPDQVVLPAGAEVGDFTIGTEDGTEVSRDGISTETLVGVFSPSCGACTEQIPVFAELARSFPGGRENVLAVVVGPREESMPQVEQLTPVARVGIEGEGGAVAGAFQVRGYPAFARVSESGHVLASGYRVEDLKAPAGV